MKSTTRTNVNLRGKVSSTWALASQLLFGVPDLSHLQSQYPVIIFLTNIVEVCSVTRTNVCLRARWAPHGPLLLTDNIQTFPDLSSQGELHMGPCSLLSIMWFPTSIHQQANLTITWTFEFSNNNAADKTILFPSHFRCQLFVSQI